MPRAPCQSMEAAPRDRRNVWHSGRLAGRIRVTAGSLRFSTGILRFQRGEMPVRPVVRGSDNAAYLYVSVFVMLFSGVIGRYFGAITLGVTRN